MLTVVDRAEVRRADHQGADGAHQGLAGLGLDLAPERMRTHGERHIVQALADGLAGDAALAVAGALVVRRMMPIQAQHARAAARRLMQGRGARRAQADDDQVEAALAHPSRLNRLALPPAEVVSTVQVRSTQKRGR